MSPSSSGIVTTRSGRRASSARSSASRRAITEKLRNDAADRAQHPRRARRIGERGSVDLGELLRHRFRVRLERRRGPGAVVGQEHRWQRLVQDEGAEVIAAGGQLLAEELRLAQGRALQRRHDGEGRPPVVEQTLDRLGPLDEPGVHRLEVEEELGDVLQELAAEDPVGELVEGLAREVHGAARRGGRRCGTAW